MERMFLAVLIMPILAISIFTYFRKKSFNFNAYEIFVFFISIYTVFVPIDHLLGFQIREHETFLSLNYDRADQTITYDIIFIVLLYYCFFISASIAYFSLQFIKTHFTGNGRKQESLDAIYSTQYIPSVSSLIIVNSVLFASYVYIDINMLSGYLDLASSLKQVRAQVGLHHEPIYRNFSFISNVYVTFNILVIILSKEKKLTLVAVVAAIFMALYTGNRSTLLIVVVIALLVHKPLIKRAHSLLFICSAMLVFVYFKPTYNYVVGTISDKDMVGIYQSYSQIDASLSRIEALSPFEVIRVIINDKFIEHQYGSTYFITTIKTAIPKIFYKSDTQTLAVQFKEIYAPSSKGYFGFSPIAEAIINFGYIGVPMVGLLFGVYLFTMCSIKIGIFYYLNIMVIIRFFRTDFAGLFKRFFIVESFAIILVMISLTVIFYLFKKRRLIDQ